MAKKKQAVTKKETTISWTSIAVMTFCTLWGFNNLITGTFYFGQTRVIGVWFLVFLLYFLPYSLMVGELGSVFRKYGGGTSSWVYETVGPNLGYFAGWIGWVVILPYLAQKPSLIIVAANWMINQNGDISNLDPMTVQLVGVAIFLVCVFLASKGIKVVKVIASIAGTASFIMAMLFIVFGLLTPFINLDPVNVPTYTIDFSPGYFFPTDLSVFASLSILLFGVGGAEKVAPYVNKMEKPGKDFPKGIIAVVIMVAVAAFAGAFAMATLFGQDGLPDGFITNGQYICFQKVGQAFGLGNSIMVLYAAVKFITDVAVLIVSIDVPLRLLLAHSDARFIPKGSLKQNKHGAYTYWLIVVTVIVVALLVLPALGMGDTDGLIKWLLEICSIVMPIFYICVFVGYLGLKITKNKIERHKDDFIFIKNKTLGSLCAIWLIAVTFVGMVMQIYKEDMFQFMMNLCIPIVLLGLGLILPFIANIYNKRHGIDPEKEKHE